MTDDTIKKLLKKNKTKDITCLLLTNPVSEWWDIMSYFRNHSLYYNSNKVIFKPDSSEKKQLLDIIDLNRKKLSLEEILICPSDWEKYYDVEAFFKAFTAEEIISDIIERFINLENIEFNEKMLTKPFNIWAYIRNIQYMLKYDDGETKIRDYFDKVLDSKISKKKKIDLFSILYCFNINNKNIFDNVIFTDETYDIIKKYQNKIMQRSWCTDLITYIAINNKTFIIESLKRGINIFKYILPFNFNRDDEPLNSTKKLMAIAKEYFNDEEAYKEYIQKYLFNKISFNDFISFAEDPLFRENLQYMNSEKQEGIREYFKFTDSLNDDCQDDESFIYAAKLKDHEFYNLITNKTRNLSNTVIKKLVEIRKNIKKSGKIFSNGGYTDCLLRYYPEIYYLIVGDIISQKVLKSDPLLKILKESGMIKGISLNIIPNDDVSEDTINLFLQLSDNKIQ